MISFNIWGACVTRDMLQDKVLSGEYEVRKWISFNTPITTLTKPYDGEFDVEAMPWGTGFFRRNMRSDLKKDYFEYLFSEESDYILVDMIDSRMDIVKHGDCMLTVSNQIDFNWNYMNETFGEGYWERFKLTDFDDGLYCRAASDIAERILEKYRPDQIILNRHYGVKDILDREACVIERFPPERCEEVERANYLYHKLNDVLEKKFYGCHVINFPDNVIADKHHQWGLLPLHYDKLYYEYGGRAISEILNNSPEEERNLELLRLEYSRKFLDLR